MALVGDHGDYAIGGVTLVNGLIEVVGGARARKIGFDDQVDLEGLDPFIFFGKYADDPEGTDTAHVDLVWHGTPRSRRGCPAYSGRSRG